jgi:hypothetical protein
VRLELKSGGSSKFWEITLDGRTVTTRWGAVENPGESNEEALADATAARAAYEQQLRHLEALDVDDNFRGPEGLAALAALGCPIVAKDQKGDGEYRCVSVGEQRDVKPHKAHIASGLHVSDSETRVCLCAAVGGSSKEFSRGGGSQLAEGALTT